MSNQLVLHTRILLELPESSDGSAGEDRPGPVATFAMNPTDEAALIVVCAVDGPGGVAPFLVALNEIHHGLSYFVPLLQYKTEILKMLKLVTAKLVTELKPFCL